MTQPVLTWLSPLTKASEYIAEEEVIIHGSKSQTSQP
jgi:hypothetical protein